MPVLPVEWDDVVVLLFYKFWEVVEIVYDISFWLPCS